MDLEEKLDMVYVLESKWYLCFGVPLESLKLVRLVESILVLALSKVLVRFISIARRPLRNSWIIQNSHKS